MKLHTLQASLASCLLIIALAGCDKSTPTATTTTEDTKKAADTTAATVQQGAEKAATEVKQATEKAVETATTQLKPAGDEVTSVLAKAQGQVAEKKYQDALATLATLKDAKLTDNQQKLVDELKAQIQKYMTGEAGKKVGDLLGK